MTMILPPRRRLALLSALLATAAGGAAYVTFAADPVEAAPAVRPAPAVHRAAPSGVPAAPGAAPNAAPNEAPDAAPDAAPDGSASAAGASAATKPAAPDTIVIEREVFGYGRDGRRDPFRSLIVTAVLRPFVSELRLVGVAYDPAGVHSVAILRDLTTKAQHRVRAGQLVGRMRVVRIQPQAVVFAVEELGFSRRETLTLHDSLGTRQP